MSLLDQHFEDALRDMPQKKLSFWANRRIKKTLRQRLYELEGRPYWMIFLPRLVAVPITLIVFLTSTVAYGFYSPSVIQSDFLYGVKERGEVWRYPTDKAPEERISYHLWLSDRRYDEVKEILRRKTGKEIVLLPKARAADNGNLDGDDPLDAILQSTLERAAEQVETAFVIVREIPDVQTATVVKGRIQITLENHQQFLLKAKPVLAQVKLKKPQLERRQKLVALREKRQALMVSETAPVAPPESSTIDLASNQPAVTPSLFPPPLFPVILPELPPTTASLLEETLAFQHSLLQKMNQELSKQVDLKKSINIALLKEIAPLREEADETDQVLKIAFEEHQKGMKKRKRPEVKEMILLPPVPVFTEDDDDDEDEDDKDDKDDKGASSGLTPAIPEIPEKVEIAAVPEKAEEGAMAEAEPVEIAATQEETAVVEEQPQAVAREEAVAAETVVPGQLKGKPEKEKDECEIKADKICEKSDLPAGQAGDKDCREKKIKECREEKEKMEKKEKEEKEEKRDQKRKQEHEEKNE